MIQLVRHGQSVLNAAGVRHRHEDTPLTTLGLQQAAIVRVAGKPTVVTSPLLRAYATACIIAHANGLEAPIVIDELGERDWEQTCDDIAEPAAEMLRKLEGDIIAVTHAGVIKGLMGLDQTPPNGSTHLWQP